METSARFFVWLERSLVALAFSNEATGKSARCRLAKTEHFPIARQGVCLSSFSVGTPFARDLSGQPRRSQSTPKTRSFGRYSSIKA